LGFTLDDLRSWKPAPVTVRRGRRKASEVAETSMKELFS
jgi:hypothetical protein